MVSALLALHGTQKFYSQHKQAFVFANVFECVNFRQHLDNNFYVNPTTHVINLLQIYIHNKSRKEFM